MSNGKKIKIGIITHHYVKNYGAFLQARALSETLKKIYNTDAVYIINYVYLKHLIKNIIHVLHFRIGVDTIKTCLNKIKQLCIFSKCEHSLKRTKIVFSQNKINKMNFDLIVFGSDEIWDVCGTGYRKVKFGVGINGTNTKLISYAPSVGKTDENFVLSNDIKESLKKFYLLSARDIATQKIIRNNIDKNIKIVLDPTLLYDFSTDINEDNIKEEFHEYILIYDCNLTNNQIREVKKYAANNNLEIIGAGDVKDYYTNRKVCWTPYEWVNLFKNARFVITGTFHGTIFSIKYKKDFISYPTEKNRIQKISSLLKILKLEDRLLKKEDVIDFKKMLNCTVDYDEEKIIEKQMYEDSIDFLSMAKRNDKYE